MRLDLATPCVREGPPPLPHLQIEGGDAMDGRFGHTRSSFLPLPCGEGQSEANTLALLFPPPCGEGRRAKASRGGGSSKKIGIVDDIVPPPDRRFATATLTTLARGRDK